MRALPALWYLGPAEAGCDEAGRGCLAGPVFAAAVRLDPDKPLSGLGDSKRLTAAAREDLRCRIEELALDWAVGMATAQEVDALNILNASLLAMHRAVAQLKEMPLHLHIDGNRFKPYGQLPYTCHVGGDGKIAAIAAASILAKTHRDAWMEKLDRKYPEYGWKQNKGYPTDAHCRAITSCGHSPHHRMTFKVRARVE